MLNKYYILAYIYIYILLSLIFNIFHKGVFSRLKLHFFKFTFNFLVLLNFHSCGVKMFLSKMSKILTIIPATLLSMSCVEF